MRIRIFCTRSELKISKEVVVVIKIPKTEKKEKKIINIQEYLIFLNKHWRKNLGVFQVGSGFAQYLCRISNSALNHGVYIRWLIRNTCVRVIDSLDKKKSLLSLSRLAVDINKQSKFLFHFTCAVQCTPHSCSSFFTITRNILYLKILGLLKTFCCGYPYEKKIVLLLLRALSNMDLKIAHAWEGNNNK